MPGNSRSGRRSKASLRPQPAPWIHPETGEAHTRAPTIHELLDFKDLVMTGAGQVSDEEYRKLEILESLIDWLISREPWPMPLIHMLRAWFVREGMRQGYKLVEGTAGDYTAAQTAYDYAAAKINNTPAFAPAKGGAAAMKVSYEWFERRPRKLQVRMWPALRWRDGILGRRE